MSKILSFFAQNHLKNDRLKEKQNILSSESTLIVSLTDKVTKFKFYSLQIKLILFMTPFIFWLNEEGINELITFIIRSDSENQSKNENLNNEGLQELTEKLLLQNDKLIKLFRKIELLHPVQKNASQIFGLREKCNHYKNQLASMKSHCNVYNNPSVLSSNGNYDLACHDCPVNTLK